MARRSRQGQLCVAHFLRGFLYVLVHPAAFQRGDAGAAQFEDGVIREHLQEGVDLFGLADQFKDHAVRGQVDDLGLVDAAHLPQLRAVVDIGGDLEQQQLPLQRVLVVEHEDLAGDFQPLGLENELVQLLFGAGHRDRDTADGGIVGGGNGQAVDVEAAAAEQVGHTGQNAALVVHQQTDDSAFGFHGAFLLTS